MPTLDGKLTGQNRGTAAIAVVADLQEVTSLAVAQRGHGEVIHQQHVGAGNGLQQPAQTTVGPCLGQIAKQLGGGLVEHAVPIATSFLSQGLSQPRLSDSGRPRK